MHVSSSYSIGSGTSPVDASQASQRRNANADDAIAKPDPSEEPIARPKKPIDGFYTIADHIVLKELYHDINNHGSQDVANCSSFTVPQSSLNLLESLNDPTSECFQPDVLSSWDFDLKRTKGVRGFDFALRAYVSWARTVVRHETDVIFLSHLLIYTCTLVPSAIYLYSSFSWIHGVLHTVFAVWCAGAFTLLLHNHIHNRGVLSKEYAWLDFVFPYVLEPLMGHTWDSYFYHHVKHHHVEGNGPDDLSSTIRYQRDSLVDFAKYEARFLALLWLELPLYFWTRKKYGLAVRAFGSEMASLGFMVHMAWWHLRATVFVLIIPFCVLRLGLMIGNWGQHALVDEVDPESDFRSSITLIDVPVCLAYLLSISIFLARRGVGCGR
jgi:hypothetical protein